MSQLMLILAVLASATSTTQSGQLPTSLDLATIREMAVQHDGRWPPLETVARDYVDSITGDPVYQDHDPVLVLLAWTFDSRTWMSKPLIRIANAELRMELQLSPSKTVFSFEELAGHHRLHDLIDQLPGPGSKRKLDPLELKVSKINGKLITLQRIFADQVIRPIPDADDDVGFWRPIGSLRVNDSETAQEIKSAWGALRQAFLKDNAADFASASQALVGALGRMPSAHQVSPKLIQTELRYNRLAPFHTAWQVLLGGAALAAVGLLIRLRLVKVLAVIVMATGFAILTYGLSLRWQIAGRIPASNMYESLLFLSWGMSAFAILSMLIMWKKPVVALTASGMGALALFLSDVLPLDSFVRPIAPVLMDTVWMSIHVPIIMVSYSILALGVLVAHAQLAVMAATPAKGKLIEAMDSLHYWYIHVGALLLLAGIITGSMWAASSWGRYWGWDPKEVWSLVAFLGYMTILHVRLDNKRIPPWAYAMGALLVVALFVIVGLKMAPLSGGKVLALSATAVPLVIFLLARGPLSTALKSVLAFWMIIMTYVGVNYVLGIGLHSYGFGTGAVAIRMLWIGGIDLALIGLCCLVYLIRRGILAPAGDVLVADAR